jgi:hypothetical protein
MCSYLHKKFYSCKKWVLHTVTRRASWPDRIRIRLYFHSLVPALGLAIYHTWFHVVRQSPFWGVPLSTHCLFNWPPLPTAVWLQVQYLGLMTFYPSAVSVQRRLLPMIILRPASASPLVPSFSSTTLRALTLSSPHLLPVLLHLTVSCGHCSHCLPRLAPCVRPILTCYLTHVHQPLLI